ncbi:MAG: glycosyltransferase family 4 protein [Candidatus Thorarchaeota archaeon]
MSSSNRILMILPRYKPAIGGLERHAEKVCRGLQDKGYKISILTSSHTKTLLAKEYIDGIPVIRIPYGIGRNPILSYLWMLKNRKRFRDFNIVHIHDPLPLLLWYFPLLVLRNHIPVYATFHGFERDPVPVIFRIIRKIARKLIMRVLCIGGFIENIYHVRCDAISIGAVEDVSKSSDNKMGLVFVGRLEEDTGIMEYMHALLLLKDKYDVSIPLTVCGSGSLSTSLETFVQENGLDVHFKGLVDDPISIISANTIALAAGYLSILEAMIVGLPVIAIAKSPLKYDYYRQVIVEGGPISIQTTPERAAREINRLLTNLLLYQYISTKGKKFASTLTWERIVLEYLALWTVGEKSI